MLWARCLPDVALPPRRGSAIGEIVVPESLPRAVLKLERAFA